MKMIGYRSRQNRWHLHQVPRLIWKTKDNSLTPDKEKPHINCYFSNHVGTVALKNNAHHAQHNKKVPLNNSVNRIQTEASRRR